MALSGHHTRLMPHTPLFYLPFWHLSPPVPRGQLHFNLPRLRTHVPLFSQPFSWQVGCWIRGRGADSLVESNWSLFELELSLTIEDSFTSCDKFAYTEFCFECSDDCKFMLVLEWFSRMCWLLGDSIVCFGRFDDVMMTFDESWAEWSGGECWLPGRFSSCLDSETRYKLQ